MSVHDHHVGNVLTKKMNRTAIFGVEMKTLQAETYTITTLAIVCKTEQFESRSSEISRSRSGDE